MFNKKTWFNRPNTSTPLSAEAINDLENRIETEFEDQSSKIMDLLVKFGLIKDYVIEIGKNSNGSYEKWHSGKLVQWGKTENAQVMTNRVHTFPVPFISDNSNTQILLTVNRSGNYKNLSAQCEAMTVNLYGFNYYINSPNSTINALADYLAIGSWKV